jgi:hypothetical protein
MNVNLIKMFRESELQDLISKEHERLCKRITRSTTKSLPEEEKVIENYCGERPSKKLTTRSLPEEEKVLETSASASSNGKKKKKKKSKKKKCFRQKSIVDLTYLDVPQRAAFVANTAIEEKSLIAICNFKKSQIKTLCKSYDLKHGLDLIVKKSDSSTNSSGGREFRISVYGDRPPNHEHPLIDQEKSVVDLSNLSKGHILHHDWAFEEKLVIDRLNLTATQTKWLCVSYDIKPFEVCILTKKTDASAASTISCSFRLWNQEYDRNRRRFHQWLIDANNEE